MFAYLFSAVTIIIYIWLTVLASKHWRRSPALRRFIWLIGLGALWLSISVVQVISKNDYPNVPVFNLFTRLNFASAVIIAFMGATFALHFPSKNVKLTSFRELLFSIPAIIAALFSLWGNYIFVKDSQGFVQYTNGYWPYIAVVVFYFIVIGLGTFISKHQKARGLIRLQLLYLSIGYGVTITLLLINSILNATIDLNDYIDLWMTTVGLVFIGACFFSVVRYRLLGLQVLLRRGVMFAVTGFILFFLYTYAILQFRQSLQSRYVSENTITIVAVLMIVLSYPFFNRVIRRIVNSLFSPSEAVQRERLVTRVTRFSESMNYDAIFRAFLKELHRKAKTGSIIGLALERKEGYDQIYPKRNQMAQFDRSHDLIQLLVSGERILLKDEVPYLIEDASSAVKKQLVNAEKLLHQFDADVVLLLGSAELAPALLFLGEKPNHSAYTAEEITFLIKLAKEMSSMFDNFFLYQQALRRVGVEV